MISLSNSNCNKKIFIIILFICCLSSYSLKSSFVITARTLGYHTRVLAEFKTRIFEKINTQLPLKTVAVNEKCQTDAFTSVPEIKGMIDSYLGESIKRLQPLVDQILHQERLLSHDYYVFYHGQEGIFRVIQDIAKDLIATLGLRDIHNFVYLRFPEAFFEEKQSLEDFIDQAEKKYGKTWCDDNTPELKKRVLSVNLSLFGSVGIWGECTFEFFLNSSNIGAPSKHFLLKEFFKQYDFNESYIDQVLDLYQLIETAEGNLLQIFIPKSKVDQCVYLSHAFATPYRPVIISDIYDNIKERHVRIAPILEKFKLSPASLPDIRSMQARLVCFSNTFLDPDFGIKIYPYNTATKEQLSIYKKRLKEVSNAVIADWIERHPITRKDELPLSRLKRYIYGN